MGRDPLEEMLELTEELLDRTSLATRRRRYRLLIVSGVASTLVLGNLVWFGSPFDSESIAAEPPPVATRAAAASVTTTSVPLPAVQYSLRPAEGTRVALTLDDGPDPRYTPRVLEILRAEGVHATFCMIGVSARQHPALVRAVHDGGHALCNHTEHHVRDLGQRTPEVIGRELSDSSAAISAGAGAPPAFYRAPAGKWSPSVLSEVQRQGLRPLGWNVDPGDYRKPAAALIVARVLEQVRPGAIILLHDGGADRTQTIQALPEIIRALRARGYTFVLP